MSNTHLNPTSDTEIISWEATISAWVDGEGEIEPSDLDTPYGRQLWDNYHLIGDVLRSPDLAIAPSEAFYARLSKAIDDEPTVLAPGRYLQGRAVRVALSSVAVAALAVTVFWFSSPYFADSTTAAPILATASDDWLLVDYMDAHRDFSAMRPMGGESSYDLGARD